jgi:hypothetical protein
MLARPCRYLRRHAAALVAWGGGASELVDRAKPASPVQCSQAVRVLSTLQHSSLRVGDGLMGQHTRAGPAWRPVQSFVLSRCSTACRAVPWQLAAAVVLRSTGRMVPLHVGEHWACWVCALSLVCSLCEPHPCPCGTAPLDLTQHSSSLQGQAHQGP